jgi:predicted acyl esterase
VYQFRKGHRIMVQIQSTWFPLVARNPQKFMTNNLMGTGSDFSKATERIYRGSGSASSILLPILKK